VFNDANQSIPSGSVEVVLFPEERFNSGGMHVGNQLIATVDGLYQISASVMFDETTAPAALGERRVTILAPAAVASQNYVKTASSSDNVRLVVTSLVDLVAGSAVQLAVFQNSGVAKDIVSGPFFSPEFMMVRVGEFVP
jgi:hypothetical protein